MTDRIAELEALLGKATKGPWSVGSTSAGCRQLIRPTQTLAIYTPDDADIIVALRNNAEALIAVVRAAQRQERERPGDTLAELRDALEALAKLGGEVK
jgi:hypothetical protein